jgi:hypothetical protein
MVSNFGGVGDSYPTLSTLRVTVGSMGLACADGSSTVVIWAGMLNPTTWASPRLLRRLGRSRPRIDV